MTSVNAVLRRMLPALLLTWRLTPCYGQGLDQLLSEAWEIYSKGDNERARVLYERSLAMATDQKNAPAEARASLGLGYALDRTTRYSEARRHL